MALGSTQPLTETSATNLSVALPARKADELIAIYEPIVKKMWEPRRLTILWTSTAVLTHLARNRTPIIRSIFYSMVTISMSSFSSVTF
jgi:hypothetical protein